jgi:drug/metabolite transporter (DMT)-like permease
MSGIVRQTEGAVRGRAPSLDWPHRRAPGDGAPVTAHLHLTAALTAIVIAAGVLHACWNAIIARADDRLMAFGALGIAVTVAGVLALALAGLPYRTAIAFAVVSGAIHVGYDLALMNSYRIGAFNQTYPIARGTSPLVVAVAAYFLAGEHLGVLPLAGIAILAAGLMSLALSSGRLTRGDLPAVAAAVLTGLVIAAYTVVDGLGVRRAHDPYAYAGLLFLLQGPPMTLAALARRPVGAWRDVRLVGRGLAAGALAFAAYGIVLWAQLRAPLAEVAAVRETSVIFAALIGMVVLRERFGARRVAAAAVIAVGILLISA